MLCLDLEGVTATTTLKQHTMNISTRAKTGRPTGSVQQIAWKHVNQWTISAYSGVELGQYKSHLVYIYSHRQVEQMPERCSSRTS